MDFYSNLPVDATATPTLFEIISSQEIDGLLKPTFQYLSANAIQRAPSRTRILLHTRFDELYGIFKLLLEYYHLKRYNATFIEKFYGLQRERTSPGDYAGNASIGLSHVQVGVVLFEKVVGVYLIDKLDRWHGSLYGRRLVAPLSRWEQWFVKWYPRFKKLIAITNLLCKLGYLSGRFRAISVLEHLASIQYTRSSATPAGAPTVLEPEDRLIQTNWPRIRSLIYRFLEKAGGKLGSLSSELFPTFIFTIRLLQQWSQQPAKKHDSWDNLSSIPPPPRPDVEVDIGDDGNNSDTDSDIPTTAVTYSSTSCPICNSDITNPGVLQTGYVACYPCAVKYVEEFGICPVMKTPLLGGTKGVRKLLC
ncbi:ubiquitin-protein ligase peroxin 12 Ecym_4570 [Eremothecium cymbalariae DBVPG|uniref:Peroxisome assembly protein 12 n=1 Tax=Eremothecium cymbalariae (strain CBS 270.75 / DBVPG 7215 / KCTC 17166 / NRRL Y-17582) TaxID=931890 RepID=G8JS81_ERECY|nr:hypothetical protein Ecym_4570 [Eremothecium cymbalariae DBVPG\